MTTEKLNQAIKKSFENYKEYGARSTEKLISLHSFLGNVLESIFKENVYGVQYNDGSKNKERLVIGKYYNKKIDITVLKNDHPVFCLGIKFITSNFSQNANNYFENMMGETANIQANTTTYAQIIVLRENAPYYKKDGSFAKTEKIKTNHLSKYIKLALNNVQAHRPIFTCIHIIKIDETTPVKVTNANIKEIVADDLGKTFTDKFSFDAFLKELKHIKVGMELKKF